MSLQINNRCISCGACEWECPSAAIHPGAVHPVVEADRCTECWGTFLDPQCAVVCPAGAITVDVGEPEAALARRYRALFADRAPTDTFLWRSLGDQA